MYIIFTDCCANICGYHKRDTFSELKYRESCKVKKGQKRLIWDMMINLENKSNKSNELQFITIDDKKERMSVPIISKNCKWTLYFIMFSTTWDEYENTTMTVSKIHPQLFGKQLPEDDEFISFNTIPSKNN